MSGSTADRRTIIGAGALVAGAGVIATAACAQDTSGKEWTPAAEEQDAWLDMPDTRHRMVFDTTSADAAAAGVNFANNFYLANQSGYGLKPEQIGVVLILRARSTPFGYNDSIWVKYNKVFAGFLGLKDEMAEQAKTMNPLFSGGAPEMKGDEPVSLAMLQKNGARFAICGMATTGIAGFIAKSTSQEAKDVEAELKANLVPGGIIVPAGIVAVNRAQEHGFAFAYVQG
jgi:intracellular sulfur oxidation DsrE/DsrF family protein